jgi:hypothetical protein
MPGIKSSWIGGASLPAKKVSTKTGAIHATNLAPVGWERVERDHLIGHAGSLRRAFHWITLRCTSQAPGMVRRDLALSDIRRTICHLSANSIQPDDLQFITQGGLQRLFSCEV